MPQGLPSIPMGEATERERRILERLHTPFDNEERLAIVREELENYKQEILSGREGEAKVEGWETTLG